MDPKNVYLPEILFEFMKVGNSMRVCAIDPRTRVEVVIVGDPKRGQEALKRVAANKLRYVLAKRASGRT